LIRQDSAVRGRIATCLASIALLSSTTAPAQPRDPDNPGCPPSPSWSTNSEMRFTVQQVDGESVLLGEGVIDDNLIPRLAQALRSFRGAEVWLRSPGGNPRVGNRAGMLLRANNLRVRVPAGWACAGSCAFMFLGGIERYVDDGGTLAVRMFTNVTDPAAVGRQIAGGGERAEALINGIALESAREAAEDNDYLIRMGVSRNLLTDIVYRMRGVGDAEHPVPLRCLTAEELRRYNVVNTAGLPSPLAGVSCRNMPPRLN
jgi:hypothetical protein